MKGNNKIFFLWLSVFIISLAIDIFVNPGWRSFLYFVVNIINPVSLVFCLVYFPKKRK